MAEGRNRADWSIASWLLAWIGNTSQKVKGAPFRPSSFDPYRRPEPKAAGLPPVNIKELKGVIMGMMPKGRKRKG